MKKSIQIEYTYFNSFIELPVALQELYNVAKKATKMAYAPYSNFQVGCAIELKNGKIITGSNQENAAYPSGLCAERSALFHIGSTYSEKVKTIAIAARLSNETNFKEQISPCGSCRQVMSEFETKQKENISILIPDNNNSFVLINSVNDLLPFVFTKKNLNS